jgi:hypothetical protein
VRKLKQLTKRQDAVLRECYVYAIRVDGVVRYIGKGRNGRMYYHVIDAKRLASKPEVKIRNLVPHWRKMLVSAVRRGAKIAEKTLATDLSDNEAYIMERHMIGTYHKRRTGQLWNTIDERFLDPKYLPEKWSNPVNPLYRLARPLSKDLSAPRVSPSSLNRRGEQDHERMPDSARLSAARPRSTPVELMGSPKATLLDYPSARQSAGAVTSAGSDLHPRRASRRLS